MNTIVKSTVAALAVALLATSCSGAESAGTRSAAGGTNDPGSVRRLTALAGQNVDVDYTPLASPADARKKADLIVEGTLATVENGIRLAAVDPAKVGPPSRASLESQAAAEETYVTFVVNVSKVLHGDARKVVAGKVYLSVYTDGRTPAARLTALNPRAKVVAVLDDITTWRPSAATTVVRPANIPAGAPLYAPFTDGLWLQGRTDAQMLGVGLEAADLTAGWKHARTVDQFAAAFR